MIGTGTALLVSAIIGALGAGGTMAYNAIEANKNREFQRDMRDTSLISTIEQAKQLGISPSLVLGQSSNAVGGSMASVGTPPNTVGRELLEYVKQDRYLDTLERLQKNSNTVGKNSNFFDDLSKIDFKK